MSPKIEKEMQKLVAQQDQEAKNAVAPFYPDGIIANFSHSSEQQPLAPLLAMVKAPPDPKAITQEQLAEQCLSIRNCVKAGMPGNIEIQLNKGRQLFEKHELPLGNTAIKLRLMDDAEPRCFFIKSGDTLDTSIFIGGDNAWGIMVLRDEHSNDQFLRLPEFHLLSLRENPDPHKEIGLITSYFWLTAKVYSSVIFAHSLDPIKNLLLSEWLQAEWQRAKDAATKSSNKVEGGKSNG